MLCGQELSKVRKENLGPGGIYCLIRVRRLQQLLADGRSRARIGVQTEPEPLRRRRLRKDVVIGLGFRNTELGFRVGRVSGFGVEAFGV